MVGAGSARAAAWSAATCAAASRPPASRSACFTGSAFRLPSCGFSTPAGPGAAGKTRWQPGERRRRSGAARPVHECGAAAVEPRAGRPAPAPRQRAPDSATRAMPRGLPRSSAGSCWQYGRSFSSASRRPTAPPPPPPLPPPPLAAVTSSEPGSCVQVWVQGEGRLARIVACSCCPVAGLAAAARQPRGCHCCSSRPAHLEQLHCRRRHLAAPQQRCIGIGLAEAQQQRRQAQRLHCIALHLERACSGAEWAGAAGEAV